MQISKNNSAAAVQAGEAASESQYVYKTLPLITWLTDNVQVKLPSHSTGSSLSKGVGDSIFQRG